MLWSKCLVIEYLFRFVHMGYRWALKECIVTVNDLKHGIVFLEEITSIAEDLTLFMFNVFCYASSSIVINDWLFYSRARVFVLVHSRLKMDVVRLLLDNYPLKGLIIKRENYSKNITIFTINSSEKLLQKIWRTNPFKQI